MVRPLASDDCVQIWPTFREVFLSALKKPTIAVLATMNTKCSEARFVAEVLTRAGAMPWIVDVSLNTAGSLGSSNSL
jgi:hypothetical protein